MIDGRVTRYIMKTCSEETMRTKMEGSVNGCCCNATLPTCRAPLLLAAAWPQTPCSDRDHCETQHSPQCWQTLAPPRHQENGHYDVDGHRIFDHHHNHPQCHRDGRRGSHRASCLRPAVIALWPTVVRHRVVGQPCSPIPSAPRPREHTPVQGQCVVQQPKRRFRRAPTVH